MNTTKVYKANINRKSLASYSPRGHKDLDMTEQLTLLLHFISSIQKINTETVNLNNTLDQKNLIYKKAFYPKGEYALFSRAHGKSNRVVLCLL